MDNFFDSRLNDYESHMLECIESAKIFYPFTASLLPINPEANILDLGCGTGLELEYYLAQNPSARITGIDLSQGMLDALQKKFCDRNINLICGSYFDVPFEEGHFHAAVSVESLHHFTKEAKIPLYAKLCQSLKSGGYFILTDYFSLTDAEEQAFFGELSRLKAEQGISDEEFYHFDTPLTVRHETESLLEAGFSSVEVLGQWGATHTLKAKR
jgi:tRNA (cmo5U34)-methyltransferase